MSKPYLVVVAAAVLLLVPSAKSSVSAQSIDMLQNPPLVSTPDQIHAKAAAKPQHPHRLPIPLVPSLTPPVQNVPPVPGIRTTVAPATAGDLPNHAVSAVPVGQPVVSPALEPVPFNVLVPMITLAPTTRPETAAPVAQPEPSGVCGNPTDLAVLFSPACLDSLSGTPKSGFRASPPPPSPSALPVAGVPCMAVIIPSGGVPGAPLPFSASSYDQCFAIGARMSYGIPGMTNITATTSEWGVLAVSCKREAEDGGQAVQCAAQQ